MGRYLPLILQEAAEQEEVAKVPPMKAFSTTYCPNVLEKKQIGGRQ